MLDVSFWELLIIGAIALVVVGPERLPRLMRTLGLWAGRARASFQSIRDEVEREVNVDGVRQTRQAIDREANEAKRRVTDAVGEVEKPAATSQETESSTSKSGGDESR
ncbi:hypothetical protein SPICUR_00350 [Spiribacter curvatus]|uniref:Sec-independent protein translocase protein TatB n=1 Tax=Spiribacter curvatus TaxID=1335757 RepID=U5T0T1_9GAMM|nr:Sec-independent protein translocase protein TatB [Spiribacter curvatus]AGY91099.1 hypothetical protein SPICUR_00350 [Spiribacter curvatus]